MFPKLEYLYTDYIYVGALIMLKKNNKHPMMFTEGNGEVIGTNNTVSSCLMQGEIVTVSARSDDR